MAGKIFINYRRGDDPGFAQAMFGYLEQAFSPEQLFMDVDNIEPGLDFLQVLHDQIAQCDVLISVIGKNWVDARDENGDRRLDNPDDFVRIEIESALQQEKRVIPVLVGQGRMPRPDQLPDTLKSFVRRNAVRLTHERFRADMQGLIAALQRALDSAEDARAAHVQEEERKRQEAALHQQADAERQHREAEVRRRAEEQARQRAEAEGERAQVEQQKLENERLQKEVEAKRRARTEERRRTRPRQVPRSALLVGSILGVAVFGAIGVWFSTRPVPTPVTAKPKSVVPALTPAAARQTAPKPVAPAPAPPAPKQTAATALTPVEEWALKSGETFQECENCPTMKVVPAGTFSMGSPRDWTSSVHDVKFARQFAVGQFEVTFDEWGACVADGGCRGYKPNDQGWGRGRQPVINVSWNDARAYVAWLSSKTGKTYRLLSEAEYEYATRSGSKTLYPWGDAIGKDNANCNGCISPWDFKTMAVGSFQPNKFGLYDMVGNVWEWTEDCYDWFFRKTPPADGSAWTRGNCGSRVIRGGAWTSFPSDLISTVRRSQDANKRDSDLGFRVARTLLIPR